MDTTAFCLRAKDSADALCDEENQQSRASVLLHIQSTWYPRRKKSRSSKALQPGAKYSVVKVTSRWEIQSQAFQDQRLDNKLQVHPDAINAQDGRING
ncbi:hypothetical protein F511_43582 [Dorcoceras hygrometricum]|uniref:Uncharacterized protein n=1 Tax=Dorcoceras hygrometricum TaxID=472368 RepID=A0A2Z7B4W5_9LAMI|nr:hypothetical protein F511_43582 [Dorcoceras hygrometricum]